MAERAESAANVTRLAAAFARAMTVGLRSWGFYPPEHPAVAMAVERLMPTATDACVGGIMQLAVTPHALLLDGMPLDSSDLAVVECAELLHDRGILQVTLATPPPEPVVRALLAVLTLDRETRRARGGPAAVWASEDQTAILVEQIDYQEILEPEIDHGASRRDSLVKLNTEQLAVVTHTHPNDPFLPQVKLITDRKGEKLETPLLTNTWDRDARGDFPAPSWKRSMAPRRALTR